MLWGDVRFDEKDAGMFHVRIGGSNGTPVGIVARVCTFSPLQESCVDRNDEKLEVPSVRLRWILATGNAPALRRRRYGSGRVIPQRTDS